MTTASSFNAWHTEGVGTQLPPGANVPLQASKQVGQGQIILLDASGNGVIGDGASPGLLTGGVGYGIKLSDTNATAGIAKAGAWWGFGAMTFSTGADDGFTAADLGGVPAFDAGGNTIGRKSNVSGNNRAIVGMVYGLNDDGSARFWGGPVAQSVARAMLIANAFPLASFSIADAAANTAVAERTIRRPKVKGTVTSITFNGAAVAADASDYATVTIYKSDGVGGTHVSLGTYSTATGSNGAITAQVDAAFTLSVVAGALYLLETDIVTIVTTKGGSGKVLTGEFLINGKAL